MNNGRRFVLSISTWFCCPEQGMKDLEILNRASAFLIKANNKELNNIFEEKKSLTAKDKVIKYTPLKENKYHILTSSHVIAPWKYPKYYSQEFISYINESHTHYTVELRNEDGTFITQTELIPRSFHHSNRDLALLHLDDESSVIKTFESLQLESLELLDNSSTNLNKGDSLIFYGHDVRGDDDFHNEANDNRKPFPCIVNGTFYNKTMRQTFSSTYPILTDGMCGGPVCLLSSNEVCGVVEGIVPTNHADDKLKGLAVFVDSKIIRNFVDDVESGKIIPLLGGEAAIHVGSDQDEEKMDVAKILTDSVNGTGSEKYAP